MHNAITHHSPTNAQLVPEWPAPPYPHSLQFIYWAWHHTVWNTLLATLGQLSWLCPFPTSCAPPAFSLAGHENLKNPWLQSKHYLATTENISVLSTFFSYWIQDITLYQLLERKLTLSQLKPGQWQNWRHLPDHTLLHLKYGNTSSKTSQIIIVVLLVF